MWAVSFLWCGHPTGAHFSRIDTLLLHPLERMFLWKGQFQCPTWVVLLSIAGRRDTPK